MGPRHSGRPALRPPVSSQSLNFLSYITSQAVVVASKLYASGVATSTTSVQIPSSVRQAVTTGAVNFLYNILKDRPLSAVSDCLFSTRLLYPACLSLVCRLFSNAETTVAVIKYSVPSKIRELTQLTHRQKPNASRPFSTLRLHTRQLHQTCVVATVL